MNSYEQLSSILTAYFCNQFYEDGCAALKRDIRASDAFANKWRSVVVCIQNRELLAGQPLALVHYRANRALDDNTDEDAYIWLELMIQNVECSTGDIITY